MPVCSGSSDYYGSSAIFGDFQGSRLGGSIALAGAPLQAVPSWRLDGEPAALPDATFAVFHFAVAVLLLAPSGGAMRERLRRSAGKCIPRMPGGKLSPDSGYRFRSFAVFLMRGFLPLRAWGSPSRIRHAAGLCSFRPQADMLRFPPG
jgi:hypothetical protein